MSFVQDLKDRVLDYIPKPEWRVMGVDRIYQYLYEGENIIAYFKPEAAAKDIYFNCREGAKQDLTLSSHRIERILLVKRNGTAENPGTGLIKTTFEDLTRMSPGWEAMPPELSAYHYLYDPALEPKTLYLYPPVVADAVVNFAASVRPTPYGTVSGTTETTISSVFDPALIHYAVACCYKFDEALDQNRGIDHMNHFKTLIGIKTDAELRAAKMARLPS